MAMQPSPMAETFKPEVPSVRVSIAADPVVLKGPSGGAGGAVLLVVDVLARADLFHRAAFAAAAADALGDEDRLAVGVGVPGDARAGREVHEHGGEGRGRFGLGDRV